ncbi:CAP domain-containing protein [Histidinibacterium aquaticum]|uniref:SCP domain-containing protein n=1 Tax=Histidinibacterium aquaticum TaxID=2613962 RepID=A0A5J5GPS6_9RHOB|nr:CAP domain-containing protein [Histidinibacterium aquaticum]KAA9009432.1 hypothetical protein F3S47_09325 [Histidinibacterium aquaticum]
MTRLPLALVCLCAALPPAQAQQEPGGDWLRELSLDLVNEARTEEGLSELTLDDALVSAAQGHAQNMLAEDFYAHVAPDGETPRDRILDAGGNPWALTGENIARCVGCETPPDAERVEAFQDGWMDSPEHRENILSPGFESYGFALASGDGKTYAVQTFAGPGSATGDGLSDNAAEDFALETVNEARTADGLAPLESSQPLSQAARQALESRLEEGALPQDLFTLLPVDAEGWTTLSLRSASLGGSGSAVTEEDIESIVESWRSGATEAPFGGPAATHFGFATSVQGSGRLSAVAAFGGRDQSR